VRLGRKPRTEIKYLNSGITREYHDLIHELSVALLIYEYDVMEIKDVVANQVGLFSGSDF
jgi:hypothetical protein